MRLVGCDIDGTLLPLAGKRDNLGNIRQDLFRHIAQRQPIVLITSNANPAARQKVLKDKHGIDLTVVSVTRDWPALKGQWLLDHGSLLPGLQSIELWDDERWYLNPAAGMGITTRIAKDGDLHPYILDRDYVRWVPKTPKPACRVLVHGKDVFQ